MFYKILMDGVIVDALKNPRYVKWQERNQMLLVIGFPEKAYGVLSSDGSTAYHLEGYPEIPVEGIPTVTMVEITEEEYTMLREQLDAGLEPVVPDNSGSEETEQEPVTLSLPMLYERLVATESEVAGITSAIEKGLSL